MLTIAAMLAATAGPARGTHVPSPNAITIVINGNQLPIDPGPRIERGILLVPVRRTLDALGLPWNRSGSRVTTQVGAKPVALTIGSKVAEVGGNRVELDAPAVDLGGTLYAPLRFFTDALGAQAHYDPRGKTVAIVAQIVGRSQSGFETTGSGFTRVGTVVAVDVLSDPPTLTLGYGSGPKTIAVAPNATIDVEDVNANVVTPGELGDVRPGDFARVDMRKDGRVVRIVDEFGSRVGKIVAMGGNQFVLDDGQVVAPRRTAEISLNGKAAGFADLRPGDVVTVRYNVETNEVRELIASRPLTVQSPSSDGAVVVSASVSGALRADDVVRVTLQGPPGAAASFNIGSYVVDQAMHEMSPGRYAGSFRIPHGAYFNHTPIVAQLQRSGEPILQAQAAQTISASSIPPGIVDFAPNTGSIVNNDRPAIYATFFSDGLPVNPSSAALWVDGQDVTSQCVRTAAFISYSPRYAYPDGLIRVTVRVADVAGNVTSKSWNFTIKLR